MMLQEEYGFIAVVDSVKMKDFKHIKTKILFNSRMQAAFLFSGFNSNPIYEKFNPKYKNELNKNCFMIYNEI